MARARRKSIESKGNSKYGGPEVGIHLVVLRNKVKVVQLECSERERKGWSQKEGIKDVPRFIYVSLALLNGWRRQKSRCV